MCRLSKEHNEDGGHTQTVGNETIIGQIATFIEHTGLSFIEVFEIVPYSILLMMQKDKLHTTTGKVVKKKSGKEMMQRKKKKK